MKKNLFIGALAVFALTACSQDEVVNTNQYGNEIQFTTVANKGSRAENLWCNNYKFKNFRVTAGVAAASNEMYFENATFVDPEEDGIWTTTATHYWPETKALNFYAVAGTEEAFTMTAKGANLTNVYTVNTDVALQEDVLYAATLNRQNPGGIEKINLNFRHALAQIVFKGKVTNPHLYVEVSEVRVANLVGAGNFSWEMHTDQPYEDHNDADVKDENNRSKYCTWNIENQNYTNAYTTGVSGKTVVMNNGEEVANWTDAKDTEQNAMAMLLVPQTTQKWVAKSNTGGSFIAVKCAMFHVAKPESGFTPATDVAVWGTQGKHQWVIIPADFAWEAGKKYVYTINFGTGNGGYQPKPDPEDPDNPTPDPENPEVVLTPISFTVSIDDFDLVLDQEVKNEADYVEPSEPAEGKGQE